MARGRWLRPAIDLARRHPWLPSLLCAIAILTISSIPKLGTRTPLFPGCDKLAHFIQYLILGVALRFWSGDARISFLGGGLVFAALDEFHQRFIPGRQASLWDFVADAAGVVVGFLWSGRLFRKQDKVR
jgi:hypothetical protein